VNAVFLVIVRLRAYVLTVTVTLPAACAGAFTVTVVARVLTLTMVAVAPPNLTVGYVVSWTVVTVTLTVVPPAVVPLAGVALRTEGPCPLWASVCTIGVGVSKAYALRTVWWSLSEVAAVELVTGIVDLRAGGGVGLCSAAAGPMVRVSDAVTMCLAGVGPAWVTEAASVAVGKVAGVKV